MNLFIRWGFTRLKKEVGVVLSELTEKLTDWLTKITGKSFN